MESAMIAPAGIARNAANTPFEELYRTSRQDVFVYVSSLLRDRSLAEDVTATAFERAYRRSSSFDPRRGSRRAWLFGIARNAALDELRRRQRVTDLESEPVAETVPAVESAEASLRRTALQGAMQTLTARERELVGLKFFAGLRTAEIASVISVSEAATAMRIHRTIEKLRRACDEAR